MAIIISLLLLVSLLPNLTFTAHDGIVNGREAKPHSRPYMVSLQLNGRHICGGSLISDQFVLTAAHCWDEGKILTAVVGAHDLTDKNLLRYPVKSYIVHPEYSHNSFRNDIMLLKLQKRVHLNTKVGLISLPEDGEEVKGGCTVAGWGRLWSGGPVSSRLMEANTKIVHKCKSKKYVASQMICGYSHGGPCRGDSGGPLVCGNKPTAFGLTSFGDRCDRDLPDYTNVYTRTSAYLPWIRNVIGK